MPATSAPVLVTGATGFIAAHIVERLLACGYRVRGTVRSVKRAGDVGRLKALAGAAHRLDLVDADLTKPGSFDAPATGCAYVLHTASPYVLTAADPQRDLVDPAVDGTREVLGAAQRAGTVTRVVLTSSMAAVGDDPGGAHAWTEADWNETSSLARNPYYYSKTLAERAAWTFMDAQPRPFDLVAINPFMVVGPSLTSSLNTSNKLFVDLLKGAYPGILSLTWGMVDVRDVAEAHIRAMASPAAEGRYLCAGEAVSMRDVVGVLSRNGFSRYGLPRFSLESPLASALVRAIAFTQPRGVASYLRTHVGQVPRYDTTKIRRDLQMTFRPISQTIIETIADLERWGHLPRRQAARRPD